RRKSVPHVEQVVGTHFEDLLIRMIGVGEVGAGGSTIIIAPSDGKFLRTVPQIIVFEYRRASCSPTAGRTRPTNRSRSSGCICGTYAARSWSLRRANASRKPKRSTSARRRGSRYS